MYRNVPTLLVSLGKADDKDSIISHINNTNWNMKSLTTDPNPYVHELIDTFKKIENVLSSFPTLPMFIHPKLNKEALIYVEEQLVEAYKDCKKCTTEGRALMSLDQSVLKKSYPISKYNHSWEYTTNFIQAYYLPQQDLIKWVEQHPEYSLKAHQSFARLVESEDLKRRERQTLEKEIKKVYQIAKQREKKIKEEQMNKINKPNLKDIQNVLSQPLSEVKDDDDDDDDYDDNDDDHVDNDINHNHIVSNGNVSNHINGNGNVINNNNNHDTQQLNDID